MKLSALALGFLLTGLVFPAAAGDLTVNVTQISDEFGQIRVSVCREAEYNTKDTACVLSQAVQARQGNVAVLFPNIAPGAYGIKGYHDRNNNGELDRGFMGFVPIEGYGFSRMTEKLRKEPAFSDIVIPVGRTDTVYDLPMFYP